MKLIKLTGTASELRQSYSSFMGHRSYVADFSSETQKPFGNGNRKWPLLYFHLLERWFIKLHTHTHLNAHTRTHTIVAPLVLLGISTCMLCTQLDNTQ